LNVTPGEIGGCEFFSKPEYHASKGAGVYQASFIDILYDHEGYLRKYNGKISDPVVNTNKRVAIVGSGPAGLVAAFQLLQVGIDVEIFEADKSRYGGRIYSGHPVAGDSAIFEMGAMRVPPSEKLFGYYASLFSMESGDFPDPGKVSTRIVFDGEVYTWLANQPPPEIFFTVSKSWDAFVETLAPLIDCLKEGTETSFQKALSAWQALVNPGNAEIGFSNISFYEGLVYLFVDNYQKYGLQQPWSGREFALFGALGLGSGGFGP